MGFENKFKSPSFPQEKSESEKLTPQQEAHKKLGGELVGKPIEGPDGKWYNQFGEEVSRDEAFSSMYWGNLRMGGMKEKGIQEMQEQMRETLEKAAIEGNLSIFVDRNGLTQNDKEKLSAYRIQAKQFGYEISQFELNKDSGTVTAKISKQEK